jgi:anti-anti-sigma factor
LLIHSHDGTGDVTVSVAGEIDLATADDLEQAMNRAAAATTRRLILDLRHVVFMDSSGIAVIFRQQKRAQALARPLIVVRGPPQVQRLLDLTGLSERVELVDEPPGSDGQPRPATTSGG